MLGLPWWLSGKELGCSGGDAGNMGFTPGLRRSPEGMTGEATVHEVTKSRRRLKRLSKNADAHSRSANFPLQTPQGAFHSRGPGGKKKVIKATGLSHLPPKA